LIRGAARRPFVDPKFGMAFCGAKVVGANGSTITCELDDPKWRKARIAGIKMDDGDIILS